MAEVNSNHIPEPAADVAQTQGSQDVHTTNTAALVSQSEPTNEGHSTPVPVADIGEGQFHTSLFTTTQPSQVQQELPIIPQTDNQQVPPQPNGQQLPPATSQPDHQSQSTPTKPPPTPTHLAPAQSTNSQPTTQMAASPATRGTPARETGSRAASAHPEPVATKMPTEAAPHGAPVRQYINTQVTPVLLEGMRKLAVQRPKDPLRFLGEFFLERSKEIEGSKTGTSGDTNGHV